MPNMIVGCGGFSYSIVFFWEFFILLLLHILNDITSMDIVQKDLKLVSGGNLLGVT